MPLGYISPEQLMKDKAEYARKGIARGRSAVVLQYDNGILFVAENRSRTLHKISEIYDCIAFAAVGLYYEFENLRQAGIRLADIRGYTNARSDVTARGLANAYAQTLGSIFTDAHKPYEVELVVAEVGATSAEDQIYRLTFDGSVQDEQGYLVMGGITERVSSALAERYERGQSLEVVLREAVTALERQENGGRELAAAQLEVGVLDRTRGGRKFRRLQGNALERLLEATATAPAGAAEQTAEADAGAGTETEADAGAETEADGGAGPTAESDAEADGGAGPEAGTDGADTEATDGGGPAADSDDDGASDEGPSRA